MGFKGHAEAGFQATITQLARATGWLHYHTLNSVGSESGFPDSVFVKGKRLVFAELKTIKGKYAAAQVEWLQRLAAVETVEVYRWKPSDWNSEIVPTLTTGTAAPLPTAAEYALHGMHRHLCPECGTLWAHNEREIEKAPDVIHRIAHECPKCNRENFVIYRGDGGTPIVCHHRKGILS